MDPQSKIALITGGAQRVGKAITLARAPARTSSSTTTPRQMPHTKPKSTCAR
jgi:NAD(P)-dependent dehydrogenase (short-subunit alcohol dehydrogenase family)